MRYIFLDGMRGIAAFVVLAVHAASIFQIPSLFQSGELAVDFFFCLSGFVVAKAYDSKVGHQGFAWLMRKRIVRLYPMILLSVAVGATVAYIEGKADIGTLSAAALALFPVSLITGGVLAFPINLPMWSLFFEMVGSVGYGIERNRLSNRLLLWFVIAAGCLLIATMAAGHVHNFGVGGRAAFLVGFPRMIYPFAIGVLFARVAIKVPTFKDWQLALALILIFAMPSSRLYDGLCCIVILPAIVLLGSSTAPSAPAAWDWLGRISYPLYLLHVPILEAARYFHLGWPLAVGVAVVASVLALSLYDEPVRSWLGRSHHMRVATR